MISCRKSISKQAEHMKRTFLVATLVACALCAQAQVIESYQVRDAVTLRTPILTDSINTEGRKYEERNLLSTAIGLNQDNFATQAMEVDTAGFVALAKAEGEHLVYVVNTQIRADRFMRGQLKVTSPVRWEVYVNGVSKMRKEKRLNLSLAQNTGLGPVAEVSSF